MASISCIRHASAFRGQSLLLTGQLYTQHNRARGLGHQMLLIVGWNRPRISRQSKYMSCLCRLPRCHGGWQRRPVLSPPASPGNPRGRGSHTGQGTAHSHSPGLLGRWCAASHRAAARCTHADRLVKPYEETTEQEAGLGGKEHSWAGSGEGYVTVYKSCSRRSPLAPQSPGAAQRPRRSAPPYPPGRPKLGWRKLSPAALHHHHTPPLRRAAAERPQQVSAPRLWPSSSCAHGRHKYCRFRSIWQVV